MTACQNHSCTSLQRDPVFHLLTCLELYEGVLGLPATLIPLNEQRQVVCQAQGSLRVVLGLSRCSVLFTATERFPAPAKPRIFCLIIKGINFCFDNQGEYFLLHYQVD